jgi:alpha-glucosidase
MLALPGSSYLYQGEELGLGEVADIPLGALQDPIWVRTLNTKKGRDGARVPLPWSHEGASYGFGSGAAWLPQPSGFSQTAVSKQQGQPGSTLELYADALRLRRELQGAEELEWVATDGDVLHFRRPGGWECVMNFGDAPASLPPGQVVLTSSTAPLVDELPAETTVWITPPRRG